MQLTDAKSPNERKKMILAGVLGLVAILLLWWAFFGFGGSSNQAPPRRTSTTPQANNRATTPATTDQPAPPADDFSSLRPVVFSHVTFSAAEARRNIFAFYEPPPRPVITSTPTPTPTPTPPLLLASLSPQMVYARTGDFTLEVAGDKFAPGVRIVLDQNELPTRYVSAQQLSATVPATLIANPGSRQVMLRSVDGRLYSNPTSLNVATPPAPNYTYIGIIGTPRFIDTAILQDKNSREVLNVQKGDLLGNRFRVTSISEKELVVTDATLKIRHTIPFSTSPDRGSSTLRPTPRIETEDDEP